MSDSEVLSSHLNSVNEMSECHRGGGRLWSIHVVMW